MFKQKKVVEKGIIKYINNTHATVEVIRQDSQECKSCSGCVGAENKPKLLEVKAVPGLDIGKYVTLQIIEHSPYKGMVLILILPIINLVIGSLIGRKFYFIYPNSQDVRMIACGFLFFLLSILAVSIYEKTIRNQKQVHRRIISIDTQDNVDLIPG
ncbi:MAG: hypothetical protein CV087_02750 [Candidatus Brocadia sp. WS118]|nr:MAG: hypothetical protein CV087_02750 [Candidatus Brocadia sp. WS118]